ncbi:MAG TPA: hypothetical protein PLJ21_07205 [Pseudobdellovibrionaceae bacterium]|nr:hypothetical protein [Pseudobdellovibrionaceae bacterium]
MPFDFYKMLHLTGLFLLFLGFGGGIVLYSISKSLKESDLSQVPWKKFKIFTSAFHGLGLVFILVSGFGMLARMGGGMVLPAWIHPKLLIWVLAGGFLFLIKKKPNLSVLWYILTLVFGITAGIFGVYKPI